MENFAVIVAGGSGKRMGAAIPKQFMLLNEKPILVHTLEKFLDSKVDRVILVLPQNDIAYWEQQVLRNFPQLIAAILTEKLCVTIGGDTRYQSVKNGLNKIKQNEGIVAIHDGVRPFISTDLINRSLVIAAEEGSAVLAVDSKDSVRLVDMDGTNSHINRSQVKLVQTPQTFSLKGIKGAFSIGEREHFTDDASVYEFAGNKVFLLEGSYENIKITTPEDIHIAHQILGN